MLEMLHADGWQVGGEASGHILCLDKHSTGDGIISSLQVLASLKQLGLSLAEICADWRPFPQTLINVRHNGCDWKAASAAPLAEARPRCRAAAAWCCAIRHRAGGAGDGGGRRQGPGRHLGESHCRGDRESLCLSVPSRGLKRMPTCTGWHFFHPKFAFR
ncbi:Phosphoglucosamine mutase [Chromobacterium violaceum]|uniref:Phosphoglucosamine mutase n=1 Tax=Chromobacterium violaceum TaxID=536 RepID=A0A3S4K0Q6_CHRVL|nr:Phosphoglucosamine mutase [Chromobacterium violaceum]